MRQLATLLRCLKADVGASVNVDGDRVGFVTAEGAALSEEATLPLVAMSRLARRPGPVVTNLSTSRMVESVAREFGQTVMRTFVGEGYVIDRGMAEGAVLAGEGNGGVASLPASMTFDALLSLGLVLELMARSGDTLAALNARLPSCEIRKGELLLAPDRVYKALDGFREQYADRSPDCLDGVRVDWEDAWLHVRASNTEPLLRVIVEADTAERADTLFDDAMSYARRQAAGQRERQNA
jgi:phosphomannomutase